MRTVLPSEFQNRSSWIRRAQLASPPARSFSETEAFGEGNGVVVSAVSDQEAPRESRGDGKGREPLEGLARSRGQARHERLDRLFVTIQNQGQDAPS